MKTPTYKIYTALVAALIFWSSAFVAIKIGLRGYSPGAMALLRYLIASACMLFLYFRVPNRHRIHWRDLPAVFLAGALGIGVYNICLNYGELHVTAALASFITAQTPVIVTIFAVIFLGERLSLRGILGLFISVAGIFLIAFSHYGDMHYNTGMWFVFIATIGGSCYTIFQKQLLKKFSAIEATSFAIWGGTLSMIYYLPSMVHDVMTVNPLITLNIIYLGIFPAAIAYACWTYVLSHMSASRTVATQYAIPFITTFMGWIILREWPALLAWVGGLIAIAGMLIASWRKRVRD